MPPWRDKKGSSLNSFYTDQLFLNRIQSHSPGKFAPFLKYKFVSFSIRILIKKSLAYHQKGVFSCMNKGHQVFRTEIFTTESVLRILQDWSGQFLVYFIARILFIVKKLLLAQLQCLNIRKYQDNRFEKVTFPRDHLQLATFC